MNNLTKIINVLKYTKFSKKGYSGKNNETGYHSIKLDDKILVGQRNPEERFKNVKFDFNDKTVLDIGSNQGGMLFEIASKIKYGLGIDYDYRLINAANKIKKYQELNNLDFYCVDLEKDPLNLIIDLSETDHFDIVFLLSVCMWINNWKEVIKWVSEHSAYCLFESNGSEDQQIQQYNELKKYYGTVEMISDQSLDDLNQKNRKLFLCHN